MEIELGEKSINLCTNFMIFYFECCLMLIHSAYVSVEF